MATYELTSEDVTAARLGVRERMERIESLITTHLARNPGDENNLCVKDLQAMVQRSREALRKLGGLYEFDTTTPGLGLTASIRKL